MSIRSKVLLLLLLTGLISAIAVGLLSYKNAERALTDTVNEQLTALRETKKRQTEDYFKNELRQFEIFANQREVVAAMELMSWSFRQVNQNDTDRLAERLRNHYVREFLPRLAQNSDTEPLLETYFPRSDTAIARQTQFIVQARGQVAKRIDLVQPNRPGTNEPDEGPYARAHVQHHPFFVRMLGRLRYYDIFLIDHRSGDIVYSVTKETDYATNLLKGAHQYSALAKAFAAVRDAPEQGRVVLSDFAPYAPSLNVPAAFMATPVISNNKLVGIVAAQLNIEALNAFMTANGDWEREGFGKTGEVYLVGPDETLRTSSRFLLTDKPGYLEALRNASVPATVIDRIDRTGVAILNQPVSTQATERALRGRSGTDVIKDYRDTDVLSSYAPITIGDLRWAIMAEKDVSEALQPLTDLRNRLLLTMGAIAIAVTLFSLIAAGIFARPVMLLEQAIGRFTRREEGFRIDARGTDEFASLSRAFNGMTDEIVAHNAEIEAKNRENERLLRSVLPDVIADRVRGGDSAIAETFDNVTVLYATVGRFSSIMESTSAGEMIDIINELVDAFDEAAERHGVERIHTVGDVYLAVCGLPVPRLDHAKRAVTLAEEMVEIVHRFNRGRDKTLTLSVGLSTGEVDAGIVGRRRFVYEILGESVIAARFLALEGAANTVNLTRYTREALSDSDRYQKAAALSTEALGEIERYTFQPLVIEAVPIEKSKAPRRGKAKA